MIIYNLSTVFAFSKYKGKTLKDVLEIDPGYIDYCIINIEDFFIDDITYLRIKFTPPNYKFSKNAEEILKKKRNKIKYNNGKINRTYFDEDDNYGATKVKYRGTYAQDEAGKSDDFIDDVFDGDPEGIWNID
jgi:hypothetical protein